MPTIAVVFLIYFVASFIAVLYLMRKFGSVRTENRRIFAKSLCLAIFFTPTISIPGSFPVPAIAMLMVGLVGVVQLQGELVLAAAIVGLLPIAIVTVSMFLFAKLVILLWRLVHEVPSA